MADIKEYAYYRRGSQFALMEVDTTTIPNTSFQGDTLYKSPQVSVEDGIEIEYSFSGKYFIETTNDVAQNLTQFQSVDGKLAVANNTAPFTNYATSYALSAGKHIVLRKAGRFNGLHKISSIGNNGGGTNNKIILTTKYSGSEAAWTDFERTPDLFYAVDVLNDESDTVHVSEHLAKAVVYYVKAKLAEDAGQIDLKEYNMKEFYRIAHKSKVSREYGPTIVIPGSHAIR
tara:strand:- start:6863 stop:7552 length:690 start_codon:yes stop_codon:yes gene_type:complete